MEELEEKRKKKRKSKKSKRKKSSGKKDACYYKVKARYSVCPVHMHLVPFLNAKVGAKNWGNKSKKTNENIEISEDLLKEMIREFPKQKDDFKPHPMYDPKTGKIHTKARRS